MSVARTDVNPARTSRIARLAGLYAVTPDIADTALLARNVQAAIAGGAAAIQYRNKRADSALRFEQADAIARLPARARTLYIVNDDAALAAAVDADGLHVGEDDSAIATARALVGEDRLIGVSCYDDIERAHAAIDAGADYVAFGSFFDSSTKPAARRASIDVLRRAAALDVPVVAIGGITAANASSLIDAGATAVAVITDVFGRGDPASITHAAATIVRACTTERTPAIPR
ncbi:MAG TPA: thiamine phosphate synthase [Casimicrobiaceae bacterium]|nr:thiamine phosphate synthase [Casimicrobiaceae bacterium]